MSVTRTFSLLALLLVSCRPATLPPVAVEPPPVMLPDTLKKLTPEQVVAFKKATPEVVIVDLRETWEIQQDGRLPGASVNIDCLNTTAFQEWLAKQDPAKSYLLACALGGRSQLAASEMSAKGFKNLAILAGGVDAWVRAGQPLEK